MGLRIFRKGNERRSSESRVRENFMHGLMRGWWMKSPLLYSTFLAPFGVYIEVCGSKNFDYDYRKTIYQKNGYNVIFLHLYKTSNKWKNHFLHYLKLFTRYRNNKLDEIIRVEN